MGGKRKLNPEASAATDRVGCELDSTLLFEKGKEEVSVEKSYITEHKPITTVGTEETQIKIYLPGNDGSFLDVSQSQLRIVCRILKADGSPLSETDVVSPVQLGIASLFSQVDLEVNGRTVNNSNKLYPYRALMETVIEGGRDERWLGGAGYYYSDEGDTGDVTTAEKPKFHTELAKQYAGSNFVELQGPLFLDLFTQRKMIPPNCPLKISLTRSTNDFALMSGEDGARYKIKILDMSLFMHHVILVPSVHAMLERRAITEPMLYPMREIKMRSYMVSSGTRTVSENYAYMGRMPRRLVLALVRDENATGSMTTDPFRFEHFDLSNIEIDCNGTKVPAYSIHLDHSNPPWSLTGAYTETMQGLGKLSGTTSGLTMAKWHDNKFMYAVDLASHMGAESDCMVRFSEGHIRISLQFAKETPVTLQLLMYLELNSIMRMDAGRNVTLDFA